MARFIATAVGVRTGRIRVGEVFDAEDDFKASWAEPYEPKKSEAKIEQQAETDASKEEAAAKASASKPAKEPDKPAAKEKKPKK